jgi:L,D-peptidoglycan transpeptidase YkuD (ErfK/YbiS/YcfS/YnhG family)
MTRRTAIAFMLAAAHPAGAGYSPAARCRQLITVRTSRWGSTRGVLRLWERRTPQEDWHQAGEDIAVVLGRAGMKWGRGLHTVPQGADMKAEGDGCSPAGLFYLGGAFGSLTAKQAALPSWPWRQMTAHHAGVDDPRSTHYNQIVDTRRVKKDWASAENMIPASGVYRLGLTVHHNMAAVPGGGSCIFLHLWTGPRGTTSGCTAMAEQDLLKILRWLDSSKAPLLAQWPGRAWPAAAAGLPLPRR